MAKYEVLPIELVNMIMEYLNNIDIINCSIALIKTKHKGFVLHQFLKPQLRILTSLDFNLKKSLENEGWFNECSDTELFMKLWKKFKPIRGIILFVPTFENKNQFLFHSLIHQFCFPL